MSASADSGIGFFRRLVGARVGFVSGLGCSLMYLGSCLLRFDHLVALNGTHAADSLGLGFRGFIDRGLFGFFLSGPSVATLGVLTRSFGGRR